VTAPDISFLIAAYNAETTIGAAIASALAQDGVSVEVIVADDGSQDATAMRVAAIAAGDARVRLIEQPGNGGPSAARNHALAAAHGAWIGILDADDLMLPERSARLIALARQSNSEIVADNVLRFIDGEPDIAWPLLPQSGPEDHFSVDLPEYLRRNRMTAGDANLGYLKPVFSRAFLAAHGVAYDERLRIGEDFNIVLRALAAGARFTITSDAFYRYRVMRGSLSRSLRAADLRALLAANADVLAGRRSDPAVRTAEAAYRRSVADLLAFTAFRGVVRQRDWLPALREVANPRLWLTLRRMMANARERGRAEREARRAVGRGT
jgi:succinoglycan biosynthesis protein ExoO